MNKIKLITSHYEEEATHIKGRVRRLGIATHQDAEDLAQDAYVRALSAKKIKPKTFRQYMSTIVTNLFNDSAGKFNRRGGFHLDTDSNEILQLSDKATSPEQQVIDRQTKKTLWNTVDKVSKPNYRKILELVAQGYTSEQIARMLNMNPNTVRTDKKRALQELREKFKDE